MSADPLLLAVETATAITGVALLRGERVLALEESTPGGEHAALLLPAVDAVLSGAGVALGELDAFAVSIGPGSFTGLRVGVACVKGLAFGDGPPVVAVPTLAAVAEGRGRPGEAVAALLDAQRGELYAAVWQDGRQRLPDCVLRPEALASRVPRPCLLVGDGAARRGDEVCAAAGEGVRVADPPRAPGLAAAVGRVALRGWRNGEARDAATLIPRYLRRAEAEVRRTGVAFEADG